MWIVEVSIIYGHKVAPSSTLHRVGGTATTEEIFQLVVELSRRLLADLEAQLSRYDLTPPQALLLRQLGDPMPMKDVAGRLHCDPSNLTGIVDRLESRGLVERRSPAGDRRVKRLVLTSEGRRVKDDVDRIVQGFPGLLDLPSPDRDMLRDGLARILGRAAQPGPADGSGQTSGPAVGASTPDARTTPPGPSATMSAGAGEWPNGKAPDSGSGD